jgi:hypothetical protein
LVKEPLGEIKICFEFMKNIYLATKIGGLIILIRCGGIIYKSYERKISTFAKLVFSRIKCSDKEFSYE